MEPEDATMMDELSPASLIGGEDDETEEMEHEGQSYRIPKALKGAFLMNADYTRKTQELAEHRRALERDRRGLSQRIEAAHATVEERARLASIEDQMADFAAIDWDALGEEDPRTAQALWSRYEDFARAREQYVWSLSQKEHHHQAQAEREIAEQLMETGRVLASEIEGWSPDVAAKLVEYAAAFGVTLDELREVADPRLWKILHRAHAGEELVKQKATAKQAEQLQAVRPAIQVSGAGASTSGVRDELGTGEWMRRRNAQSLQGR